MATEERLDVAAIVGAVGKLGFAVPLALFDELDRRVTFSDEDGTVLTHGEDVELPASSRAAPSREEPLPIVLHVPKTGGTSLRSAWEPHLSKADTAYIYEGADSLSQEELAQMPPAQRACIRLVMGHIVFGELDWLGRSAEYVAFLREPKRRIRSNVRHLLVAAGTDDEAVETLIGTINEGSTQDFDNVMTRMAAGLPPETVPFGGIDAEAVQLALHNIRMSFRFVGLTEAFQQHAVAAGEIVLGRTIAPRFDNTSAPGAREVADRIDWDGVHHRNRFDQMLYDAVVDQRLAGIDLQPR